MLKKEKNHSEIQRLTSTMKNNEVLICCIIAVKHRAPIIKQTPMSNSTAIIISQSTTDHGFGMAIDSKE